MIRHRTHLVGSKRIGFPRLNYRTSIKSTQIAHYQHWSCAIKLTSHARKDGGPVTIFQLLRQNIILGISRQFLFLKNTLILRSRSAPVPTQPTSRAGEFWSRWSMMWRTCVLKDGRQDLHQIWLNPALICRCYVCVGNYTFSKTLSL